MTHSQQSIDKRALYAVAVQFFINGMIASSYIPRLPEIRDLLNVDLGTIGQVLTVASLGGLLGSWLAAKVINRVGTKKSMIFGSISVICILPLVAQASSVWMLFTVLALIMMLDPIVDVAMNIQGSNISARRSSPVMNRLHGLWSVGSVVGGLIASVMAALTISLQWHLLLTSIIMSLSLLYIGKGLLNSDEVIVDNPEAGASAIRKIRVPISLWVFAMLGGAVFVPELIGSDWSPFRMTDDLNMSAGIAGLAYVAFTVGMVIGRLSGDWVAVRINKRRQLKYAVITAFIGLSVACLIDSVPLVFIGLTISGIGISVLFPTLYDIAAQDPKNAGAALGAVTAGSRVFSLVIPISIGFLADTSWLSVGVVMAVFALSSLLVVAYLAARNYK
ncbi:MFS transporter [Leucothrix arctica]|uniref:Major facilitator superfamily (MFS) profile domain-containing protein n=1 Tax=Leucothrix arctica TaxID=1481894 RepID=A0A317CAF1_9GAMM|nr:MFS transporter [Leucothrix arctica]PWQ95518.1 hypothetical protein DKT75_12090 [Leucothrix arctica]